jgi:hypothetical protein
MNSAVVLSEAKDLAVVRPDTAHLSDRNTAGSFASLRMTECGA